MSNDPDSIASIIQGQTDLPSGVVPGGEEDQAALLTYLKTHYSDPTGSSNPLGTGDIAALPTAAFRQTPTPGPVDHKLENQNQNQSQSHYYSQYQIRAASPPNASITIPPSLAQLASQSSITISIPSFASDFNATHIPGQYDERGEMGGKRRKLPHQRAGWKEMDEEPKNKRRRGGRKPATNTGDIQGQQGQGQEGIDIMHHQTEAGEGQGQMYLMHPHASQQSQMADHGVGGSLGEMASASGGEGKPLEGEFEGFGQQGSTSQQPQQQQQQQQEDEPHPNTKEGRSAQNRRAQQVFRRKREEHIRKLEADSVALETATHHLALAEARLREVALLLEAEHIEKMALQLTLRNVSQSGSSVLDNEGALVTQPGIPLRQGVHDSEEDIQKAFKTLETQSRELAKMNRSKRV